MIDTEKVKLMTKIAIYEDGAGKKDLQIYRWKQSTYVSYKTLMNILCVTLSYLAIAAIYSVRYLSAILEDGISVFSTQGKILAGIYLVILLFTWTFSYFYYKEQYRTARKRVVRYDKNLYRLECYLKEEKENKKLKDNVL